MARITEWVLVAVGFVKILIYFSRDQTFLMLQSWPITCHISDWTLFQCDWSGTEELRVGNARPPSVMTESSRLSVTLLLRCYPHTRKHSPKWKLTVWCRGNKIWWNTAMVLGGVRPIKWLWPFCYWNAFFNPADNIILGLYLCSWTYFKHSPLLCLLSSPLGI